MTIQIMPNGGSSHERTNQIMLNEGSSQEQMHHQHRPQTSNKETMFFGLYVNFSCPRNCEREYNIILVPKKEKTDSLVASVCFISY